MIKSENVRMGIIFSVSFFAVFSITMVAAFAEEGQQPTLKETNAPPQKIIKKVNVGEVTATLEIVPYHNYAKNKPHHVTVLHLWTDSDGSSYIYKIEKKMKVQTPEWLEGNGYRCTVTVEIAGCNYDILVTVYKNGVMSYKISKSLVVL